LPRALEVVQGWAVFGCDKKRDWFACKLCRGYFVSVATCPRGGTGSGRLWVRQEEGLVPMQAVPRILCQGLPRALEVVQGQARKGTVSRCSGIINLSCLSTQGGSCNAYVHLLEHTNT
jgi:hypothetical protein